METDPTFGEKYGCLLPPVVMCSKGQVTVCVRVFNLNPDPIVIPGDVVMGILEPVEVKGWSCLEEHPELQDCRDSCKRVLFTGMGKSRKLSKSGKLNKHMKSKSGKPLSEIRRSEPQPESAEIMETGESNGSVSNCTKETKMDTSKEPSIPDHMQGLLEQCTKGWNTKQQEGIRKLLLSFEDRFSKHDLDE